MRYELFIFLFCSVFANAQTVKFKALYGTSTYDYGMDAIETATGGYIVLGTTGLGQNGQSDFYLTGINLNGSQRWIKHIGGINIDYAHSIQQTADYGFILCGYTNSFGAGGYDVYLVKTDSSGVVEWTKTYGGSDWDLGYHVEICSDGGFILCGETSSYGNGYSDIFLIRTNANGDTLWTKTYGGNGEDKGWSVKEVSDGFIIAGQKAATNNKGDGYIIKTNFMGDTLWTKTVGGLDEDYLKACITDQSGDYVFTGSTNSFGNGFDFYVIKTTSSGNVIWSKNYGASADDFGNSICLSPQGYISGGMLDGLPIQAWYNDVYFLRTDFDGNFQSSPSIGQIETEYANNIRPTSDGGYISVGTSNSYIEGLTNIFLIKLDENLITTPDGAEDKYVGIDTKFRKSSTLKIYPNPFSGSCNIQMKDIQKAEIKIYDLVGRDVTNGFTFSVSDDEVQILRRNVSGGNYFLQISSKKSVETIKLSLTE